LFFVGQWEQRSDNKKCAKQNEERKSAKLAFHHVARKKDFLGHTDAAQFRRYNGYSRRFKDIVQPKNRGV
jgi:hypothetical protein